MEALGVPSPEAPIRSTTLAADQFAPKRPCPTARARSGLAVCCVEPGIDKIGRLG